MNPNCMCGNPDTSQVLADTFLHIPPQVRYISVQVTKWLPVQVTKMLPVLLSQIAPHVTKRLRIHF